MRTIFGVDDIVLVDEDGSPSGRKVRPCAFEAIVLA